MHAYLFLHTQYNKGVNYSFLPGMLGHEEKSSSVSKSLSSLDVKGATDEAILANNNKKDEAADSNVTTVVLQSDADEVDRIMSTIHTGEDAINFFARFGSDTPLKFVNLFEVDDPKEFRPYDLVIGDLKENNLDCEYYTMSPSGIVHVVPNYSSECVSLANWTR